MPAIRQIKPSSELSTDLNPALPVNGGKVDAPLRLIKPGTTAIEYIVETAEAGEVITVTEDAYYNPHLWRSYQDF